MKTAGLKSTAECPTAGQHILAGHVGGLHPAQKGAARAVGQARDVDRCLHRTRSDVDDAQPKPRAAMPSTVALTSSMGSNMLASTALIQSSRSHAGKSPGGGPPAWMVMMSAKQTARWRLLDIG